MRFLRKIEQSAERLDRVLDSNVFSAPREVFRKIQPQIRRRS